MDSQLNCFVIGPPKSGTTLMISLLDNHPEFTAIPLEIKFYEYFHKRIKNKSSYKVTNEEFFKSKIAFLEHEKFNLYIYKNLLKLTNSGHIDFSTFNFRKFKELMYEKEREYEKLSIKTSLLPTYIKDLHESYNLTLGRKKNKGFVIKEGSFALPHINQIRSDFKNAKFIVMVRDPRDIVCSYKSMDTLNEKNNRIENASRDSKSIFNYLFRYKRTSQFSYMNYFHKIENSEDFIFIRYEDLVNKTTEVMNQVAKFLDVEFNEIMLKPTTVGNLWSGNSSSSEKFYKVVDTRQKKWVKNLDKSEIIILEYFLKPYLIKHNYKKEFKKITTLDILKSIKLKHITLPKISWKDFFRPYYKIFLFIISTIEIFSEFLKEFINIKIKKH